ncbi:type I 3-dehydroquinate dehydratase [Shouchella lonarensis]|uniref:3-dehydroquinate dehydratase n=1 Tax=Shouchella lonarensis TaxID=1464122 RepID=A0A1G6IZW2_9BACI|nr:type I 3-dehydroquinate dehydratase [Shouchella lonarensis]SDC12068.1 3-dehydroquinate dehydratase [Shouchella lonarensis]
MRIRHVTLAPGEKNICVSLMSETWALLLEEIRSLPLKKIDILEWRVDQYRDKDDMEAITETLRLLRQEIKEIPLIFTYREQTREHEDACFHLYEHVLQEDGIDFIDLEQSYPVEKIRELVTQAHQKGVFVIVSHHDFVGTPDREWIGHYVKRAVDLGADVVKLAVTATTPEEVLRLWETTYLLSRANDVPLMTMAMGHLGRFSRIGGHVFGSCATFASGQRCSAPGQLPVADVYRLYQMLADE